MTLNNNSDANAIAKNACLWKMIAVTGLMLCGLNSTHAVAADKSLRVCAAGDEMPYSNRNKEGFENDIARVLADEMDRTLEFVWSDREAIFLVSELLLKNKCDVVIGVDSDDQRVATSDPYYTSSYVFIYRKDKNLDVRNWDDPALRQMSKFAVVPGSPSDVMLRQIGKFEGNFNYTMSLIGFKSRRNQYVRYDPQLLISEVISGKADIAHVWGPEAGPYVKQNSDVLEMSIPPAFDVIDGGEKIHSYYKQSVAVRTDDTDLLQEINRALKQSKEKITKILSEEGVPLVQ